MIGQGKALCICLYGSTCLSAQCQNILLCPDISLNQIQVYRYGYTSIDLWGNMIEQSMNIPVHIFSVPLPGATFSFLQNVSLNFMLTCVRRGAYDRPLVSQLFSSQGQEVLVPVHGMIIFQFFLSFNSLQNNRTDECWLDIDSSNSIVYPSSGCSRETQKFSIVLSVVVFNYCYFFSYF